MRKKVRYKLFANIIIPILIGTIFYYLFSPNVIFLSGVEQILGIEKGFASHYIHNNIVTLLCNYFADFLWAYALVFALLLVIDDNTAGKMKIFIIALIFAVLMEILQITPFVKGTFDIVDIAVEALAEVLAVVIINKIE